METKVHKAQGGYGQRLARTNNPTKKFVAFPLSFLLLSLCSVNVSRCRQTTHKERKKKRVKRSETARFEKPLGEIAHFSSLRPFPSCCCFYVVSDRESMDMVCVTRGAEKGIRIGVVPRCSRVSVVLSTAGLFHRAHFRISRHTHTTAAIKLTTGHERKKGLFAECIVLI